MARATASGAFLHGIRKRGSREEKSSVVSGVNVADIGSDFVVRHYDYTDWARRNILRCRTWLDLSICGCVYDAPTSPALVTRNGRVVRRIQGGTVEVEKVGCELFAVYGDEGGGLRVK